MKDMHRLITRQKEKISEPSRNTGFRLLKIKLFEEKTSRHIFFPARKQRKALTSLVV